MIFTLTALEAGVDCHFLRRVGRGKAIGNQAVGYFQNTKWDLVLGPVRGTFLSLRTGWHRRPWGSVLGQPSFFLTHPLGTDSHSVLGPRRET